MKLCTLILFITLATASAKTSYSQSAKFTLNLERVTIKQLFDKIEANSEFIFVYYDNIIDLNKEVSIKANNETVEEILDKVFKSSENTFKIFDRQIVIAKKESSTSNIQTLAEQQPQKKEISGIVKDSKGQPLPGATVSIKGTTVGITTDNDGKFQLRIPNNAKVVIISFLGMKTLEFEIGDQVMFNVKLEDETVGMEEVVVVGYDKQRKSSVVSAISSIKGEELKMASRNLTTNLAGQVPGLIVIQRSTKPGYDNAEFWIRGISTFAGGTSPLVLVDGVPRKINDIEPDEIQTFSVLKDAAATAVYGAEGANGVVLITSKRGQSQAPIISLRTEHTISTPTRLPKFVSSAEYLGLYNEACYNDGQAPIFSDALIANYGNNVDPDLYPNVDWMDALLKKNTLNHRYTLNVRGGTERAKYFVSGAYYNEDGYFKENENKKYDANIGLNRYNLRSNIDLEISKTTKVSVDLAGQYLTTVYPGTDVDQIFWSMLVTPSYVFPTIYSDGTLSTFPKERDANMRNPYNLLYNSGYKKEWRSNIQSAVRLDQDLSFILKGLTYKAMVSYDYDGFFSSSRTYAPSRYYANGRDGSGNLIFAKTYSGSTTLSDPAESSTAEKRIYFENSLNYRQTFDKHVVGGMILYMQKETQYHNEALAFRKQGVVGRVTYAYANRYFIEGNFGYTGSETFDKGYRFGFFPAIGLGYMISNEPFYPESLKKVVSSFKLRSSVGRTGNDNTGGARFLYRPTFNYGGSGFSKGITSGGGTNAIYSGLGITESRFEAPYLSWEIENKQDYGINVGLFDDKIQFVGDYFNNERKGILLQRKAVPDVAGFRSAPWENYGTVSAWGFDGGLDGSYPVTKDLTVGIKSTFTFTRNKITEYDELEQPYPWMTVTGTRVNENTAYIAERLYANDDFIATQNTNGSYSYQLKPGIPVPSLGGQLGPGDIKYKDLNNDGKIDQFDQKRGIGNPYNPEIVYGFGLNVQYKGFYASAFFQGTGNSSVILGGTGNTGAGWYPFSWGVDQANYRTFELDRWDASKGDDQHPLIPRLHMTGTNDKNNRISSTWWLKNGSFLRLKNIEFGYNISKSFLEKYNLKSARIYMMGYNLALWDHIKFWDPETGNNNAGNSYPNSRSFTLGLELSF